MSKTNREVLEMVCAEVRRVRDVTPEDLFDLACMMDPGLATLTPAQFMEQYIEPGRRMTPEPVKPPPRRRYDNVPKTKARKASKTPKASKTSAAGKGARSVSNQATRVAHSESLEPDPKSRDAVRGVLLAFATDLAAAVDKPGELIRIMAEVEKYVNRIFVAANRDR